MAVAAYTTTANPSSARHSRQALEDAIERLLALLDDMDGDADAEPNGDDEEDPDLEPSLASVECQPRDMGPWSSLSVDTASSQLRWSAGGADDREDDAGDEGEEPGAMPVLGWAEPDLVRVRRARR